MSWFGKEKEERKEEIEPEKECLFQDSYDYEDKSWYCELTGESIVCDKDKCPFWKL